MNNQLLDYTNGSDSNYHELLGYKMTEWREGYVRLEMEVQPRHRQRGTYTHGGIIMGLLDLEIISIQLLKIKGSGHALGL